MTPEEIAKLKQETELKAKAAVEFLMATWMSRNFFKLYKITMHSWREKYNQKHLQRYLVNVPEKFTLERLFIHSQVLFDAYIRLEFKETKVNGQYRIRFVAEKKAYVTDEKAQFLFNPISIKREQI